MIQDSFRKPALVSLGANVSQILLIQKMKELGYSVISVDRNPEAPGFSLSEKQLPLSTHEAYPIIAELAGLKSEFDVQGVLTRSSGPPVITCAIIAEHFNLPGATQRAASMTVNKAELMKACQQAGIATAETTVIDDHDPIESMADRLPCVVKPALGLTGKEGVRLIRKKGEIESAFRAAKAASYTGQVLCEQFIPGNDICLMSVVLKGRIVPVVAFSELNEFDQNGELKAKGVSILCGAEEAEFSPILELAQKIVDITGLENSPFIMSCRDSKENVPVPIEVHLDFGADLVLDELLPLSSDFDFIKFAIRTIVGQRPGTPVASFRPASLLFDHAEERDRRCACQKQST
jgi:hypothetical protein